MPIADTQMHITYTKLHVVLPSLVNFLFFVAGSCSFYSELASVLMRVCVNTVRAVMVLFGQECQLSPNEILANSFRLKFAFNR